MPPSSTKMDYRPWIALAVSLGINLTMGINYSWSVINKALVAEFHWTSVEASLPYTTYSVIFASTMFFAGRLQDRIGPRKVAMIGSLFLGLGLTSSGFATSPLVMAATYALSGIGNGLCFSVTVPTCMKWFPPERRGLATGLVIAGTGLAPAYFSPLTNWMLSCYGIARTFQTLGVVIFFILLAFAQFMKNPPAGYGTASTGKSKKTAVAISGQDMGWPLILKSTMFRKLWFVYFLSASAGLMIMAHIAAIAKTQANWEDGFYLVVAFALFNTLGRMVSGYLSDKYGRVAILLVVFSFHTINTILFTVYNSPLLLCFGTAVTGAAYGAYFSMFSLLTADFFGMKNFGGNYGLLFTAWGGAGILGPLLAGRVVDVTGTYYAAYIVSTALLCAAFYVAWTMRQRPTAQG